MLYLYWNILMKATGWSRNMENKPYVVWTELTGEIYQRDLPTEFTDGIARRNLPTELPDGIDQQKFSINCPYYACRHCWQIVYSFQNSNYLHRGLILPVEFMSQSFKLVFPAFSLARCRKTVLSWLKIVENVLIVMDTKLQTSRGQINSNFDWSFMSHTFPNSALLHYYTFK